MCTAITLKTKDFYFGRTLDHEVSFGETVTLTPRNFPLTFRSAPPLPTHYAILGIAYVADGYPLYFDAVNEKGLAMAGLHFLGNACYSSAAPRGRMGIAQFEFLPRILAQCASVAEARSALDTLCITDTPFSPQFPPAELHWLIADRCDALTVEARKDGLHILPNPVGVLTNNPPFEDQLLHLTDFLTLTSRPPRNLLSDTLHLPLYSSGMGSLGLPGDLSSRSRFVRAVFAKLHSVCGDSESESLSRFFHILGAVCQTKGCNKDETGSCKTTLYTSCCNGDKGIYYYTTCENRQICAVDMHRENLDGSTLIRYPLVQNQQILYQN